MSKEALLMKEEAYVAISWASIELYKIELMPMEESIKAPPANTAVGLIMEVAEASTLSIC